MPFFSDYGYYHNGPAPFSSQYYSQLLPYPGSSTSSRPMTRVQPRNYNSMVVEQTLRAIRRGGPGAVAHRQYSRPVHINASEIDVTSPRRPRGPPVTETTAIVNDSAGGNIHRGRTVVRLHTMTKRTAGKTPPDEPKVITVVPAPPELPQLAGMSAVPEEGLAKKGTIKRHTSAGIKVPVTDDRRPSVTDEILREQEALFDTMIMEEMDAMEQQGRRKSYPVDTDSNKKQQKTRDTRKKSAAGAMVFCCGEPDSPTKKTNWKLNYDVIIEESGIEPVSFTFKLNKAKKESTGVGNDNGKLDANHNVVRKSHDDSNKINNKKHAKSINKNQINSNNNSDDVSMPEKKTKVVKKKIIVKKKVIKKKESEKQQQEDKQLRQGKKTPSPQESKKKGSKAEVPATATAAVIQPFVRASFGKTFISPSQVSSTKSKFEKPKPKAKPETSASPPPPPPPPLSPPETLSSKNESPASSSDDESSSDEETSSLCSSSTSSGSTYYDSDDYGDSKRIACSISSFDSGLPSSPVPATDPIGRKTIITITITTEYYANTLIILLISSNTILYTCAVDALLVFSRNGAYS